MLRCITMGTMLALSLAGMTPGYSVWTKTNFDDVRSRWQADDLNPPACTIQVDRASHFAEPIRVRFFYATEAGFSWELSFILPAQSAAAGPVQKQIVGCVLVRNVAAQPLSLAEARNYRQSRSGERPESRRK